MRNLFHGLVCAGCLAGALAARANNHEVWLKQSTEPELGGGFSLKLQQESKFNAERFYDSEQYFVLYYKVSDLIKLGPGYRFVRERPGGRGHFLNEHRPMADLLLAVPEWQTLKLGSRTRLEWRDRDEGQAYMRYRQRFALETSWKATEHEISPYAQCEFFFDDKPGRGEGDVMNRTRSRVGFTLRPLPSTWHGMGWDLYYQVQHDRCPHDDWYPTNVWGFDVKFDF